MDGMDQMVHTHPGHIQTTTMGTFVQTINSAITTHFTINIANTTMVPTDHHTISTNQKVATFINPVAQYIATNQLFETTGHTQAAIQRPLLPTPMEHTQMDIQTVIQV